MGTYSGHWRCFTLYRLDKSILGNVVMSEYKTLKEWFGEKTRGNGEVFFTPCEKNSLREIMNDWYEPIFLDRFGNWYGLYNNGSQGTFCANTAKFRLAKRVK